MRKTKFLFIIAIIIVLIVALCACNTVKGEKGDNGRGIVSIEKTSTDGYIDIYTITYTDGTTSTFTVTNANTSKCTHNYINYFCDFCEEEYCTPGLIFDSEENAPDNVFLSSYIGTYRKVYIPSALNGSAVVGIGLLLLLSSFKLSFFVHNLDRSEVII